MNRLAMLPADVTSLIEVKGKKEYTAQLLFKMPEPDQTSERGLDDNVRPDNADQVVDEYMRRVKPIAAKYNVAEESVDFLTKAVEKLQESNFDVELALKAMADLDPKKDLKLPEFSRGRGQEIRGRRLQVRKLSCMQLLVTLASRKNPGLSGSTTCGRRPSPVVESGGNYEGRRPKKEAKRADKDPSTSKLLDDVADDHDDSAFDNEKASQKKRGFLCKFCATHHSRQWRRAPGTAPGTLAPRDASAKNNKDKSAWLTLALCGRCAYLWRKLCCAV